MRLYFRNRDLFRDIKREGVNEQRPGLCISDAPRFKVEQRIFVELPDSGTMTAFHIVGKNFQLGFGVYGCLPAQHQVVVLLEGICFLSWFTDKYLSVEYTDGLIFHDPFV